MENGNILIVDDEKEIRDLVEIYLKSEGYKELSLGVEPKEVRNVNMYKKLGFTNLIKSVVEYINFDKIDEGVEVDFYYKEILRYIFFFMFYFG